MRMKVTAVMSLIVALFATVSLGANYTQFVRVVKREFMRDGKPYYYMGTNFWYGMNLAAEDPGRLRTELDTLFNMGITNLRIMGSSQGPNTEPQRMVPALELDANFTLNRTLLLGLDLLLFEMKKRGMTAVVPLNDFWHWSGGFPQYVRWFCTNDPIPYPGKDVSFDVLVNYTKKFYTCEAATRHYNEFFYLLAHHVNNYSNVSYMDDPTIMAWQIANEPWPTNLGLVYTAWLNSTVNFIKSVDPRHLLSVGIEGMISDPMYLTNSGLWGVDYLTCHLWAQNWGWYDPKDPRTFYYAKVKAKEYLDQHNTSILDKIEKPFVLEEFGLCRDGSSFAPSSTTIYKDMYYDMVFDLVYQMAKNGRASGVNFWAWAGIGRPKNPGGMWKAGDPWLGDPPHEAQGWYSVYDNDTTVQVIVKYAKLMSNITRPKPTPGPGPIKDKSVEYTESIVAAIIGAMLAGVVIVLYLKYHKDTEESDGNSTNKDDNLLLG